MHAQIFFSRLIVMMVIHCCFAGSGFAGENIWTHSSEGMNGGSIHKLAISPNFVNDQTIFAVAGIGGVNPFYDNGIFKSTDGGITWSWVFSDIPVYVRAIALSPDYENDQTVFVTTNYFYGRLIGVLLKSVDGGRNWEFIEPYAGLNNAGTLGAIGISPDYANDQTVFIADGIGNIFKSTDGGLSYQTKKHAIISVTINSFAFSPNFENDQTLFGTDGGVVKSTDGGETWTRSMHYFLPRGTRTSAISPNFTSDSTIFVGTWDDGVYKSTDAGESWSPVNNGLPSGPEINDGDIRALAISPNYASDQTLFAVAAGQGIFKSNDGAASWERLTNPVPNLSIDFLPVKGGEHLIQPDLGFESGYARTNHYWNEGEGKVISRGSEIQANADEEAILYDLILSPNYADDQTIFVGALEGVFKSKDNATTWNLTIDGIVAVVVSDVEVSLGFAEDSTVFAGAWQGLFKSTNGGRSWVLNGFKGSAVDIELSSDFAIDRTLFASVRDSLFKSTDAAGSWDLVAIGIPGRLVISTDYPTDNTLFAYTSGGGVFKSIDDGKSWFAINNGLTHLDISALAVSPDYANDQILFTGTFLSGFDGGVFKSTDGGDSWTKLNVATDGNPMVGEIAFSPAYAIDRTLFVSQTFISNFLHKSTDGGDTWKTVSSIMRANSIALSPNYLNDQTLFAGTGDNTGIFMSNNGGKTWTKINDGLETLYAAASDLVITRSYPQTLFAGASGGVWQYTIANINISFVNSNFITAWGERGEEAGEFNKPAGVAVGPDGSVYVADTENHRIQKFTATGEFLTAWGSEGNGDGQFSKPQGICVASDGSVYVADTENSRIQKFTSEGSFVTKWGESGQGDGQFNQPKDVAFGPDGIVYIIDDQGFSQGNVQQFTPEGTFLDKWTGGFWNPNGIEVNQDTTVYLTSSNPQAILRFTSDGQLLTRWNIQGSFTTPHGIAIDANEDVYVTVKDSVRKYDSTGKLLLVWSYKGEWPVELREPNGIAVGPDGTLYVADSWIGQSRVLRFRPTLSKFVPITSPKTNLIFIEEDTLAVMNFTSETIDSLFFEFFPNNYPPNWPDGSKAVRRYYQITQYPANTSFQSSLTLFYAQSEFDNSSSSSEANLQLYRLGDGLWELQGGVAEPERNRVSIPDVTAFSAWAFADPSDVTVSVHHDDEADAELPTSFALHQNYPNPFNPETTIKYQLPKTAEVKLEIFNLLGQRVATLVDKQQPAGYYSVKWNGKNKSGINVASGVYMYRIESKDFVKVRKMVLVR